MGNNSHKIVATEVRKLGLEDYLKKYKSKMSKKQLYTIARDYIHENYMLNGHTHVVVTNKILEQYEDVKGEKHDKEMSDVRKAFRGKEKRPDTLQR